MIISFFLVGEDSTEPEADAADQPVNHITEEYELNEEEVAILQRKVSDKISNDANDIIYNAGQELSSMTNEKMLALGDYAVTVCDEIEKNHKEVMFLYSMLGDKEKELKELVSSADGKVSELKKANELAMESYVAAPTELEPFDEMELDTNLEESSESEDFFVEPENTNDIILEMKRNGMSILDIAKQLGMGVGEIKLVVDLYEGEAGE